MKYFLWVFLLFLIAIRFYQTRPIYKEGDRIKISSIVTSEPVRYDSSQGLNLSGLRIYLPLFPEINYGDKVVITGEVSSGKLKKPKLIEHEPSRGFFFSLRKKLIQNYNKYLPTPHGSLVAGMVVGSRSSMPGDFWEILKKSGTAHVVVASGMNVTLVASFLMSVLLLVTARRKAIFTAVAGIWAYAFLSGLDAPIVRAAIMGSIAFGAQSLGRISLAWRSLVLSGLLMLVIKPHWLFDLGFVLSFAATSSLLVFEKRVRKRVSFLPGFLREGFSTSLAAQIFVAPILLFSFGSFSLLSPLTNALVLWTVPLITVIGALFGILSLIFAPFGHLLFLLYPFTYWFVWVVEVFS